MKVVLACALVVAALSSVAAPAEAHRRGCYLGRTFSVWDVHRVHATPHGCVWLLRPDIGHYSIGPQFRTRLHGQDDTEALPRAPIGEAEAVCGFSGLFVSWPYFVVTAHRVAWGDGTGCHDLAPAVSVIWSGHFELQPREGRRLARWLPLVDHMSPPLRR